MLRARQRHNKIDPQRIQTTSLIFFLLLLDHLMHVGFEKIFFTPRDDDKENLFNELLLEIKSRFICVKNNRSIKVNCDNKKTTGD